MTAPGRDTDHDRVVVSPEFGELLDEVIRDNDEVLRRLARHERRERQP